MFGLIYTGTKQCNWAQEMEDKASWDSFLMKGDEKPRGYEEDEGVLLWLRYLMAHWDRLAPSERVDTPMAPSTKRALEVLGYLEE